jgi:hypothetical protein
MDDLKPVVRVFLFKEVDMLKGDALTGFRTSVNNRDVHRGLLSYYARHFFYHIRIKLDTLFFTGICHRFSRPSIHGLTRKGRAY